MYKGNPADTIALLSAVFWFDAKQQLNIFAKQFLFFQETVGDFGELLVLFRKEGGCAVISLVEDRLDFFIYFQDKITTLRINYEERTFRERD